MINHSMFAYRFCPTDEQLITFYLKKKIMGEPLPCKLVIERNLYGEETTPWIIFNHNDPWQTVVDSLGKEFPSRKVIYVFTKLSTVGKTGDKNKKRIAGCGHWHGNTASEYIKDNNGEGKIIGSKRTFTFKSDQGTIGQWNMEEYALVGANMEGVNHMDDYALCKIKVDESKGSKGEKLVSREDSTDHCPPITVNEEEAIVASRSANALRDDYIHSNGDLFSETDYSNPNLWIDSDELLALIESMEETQQIDPTKTKEMDSSPREGQNSMRNYPHS